MARIVKGRLIQAPHLILGCTPSKQILNSRKWGGTIGF